MAIGEAGYRGEVYVQSIGNVRAELHVEHGEASGGDRAVWHGFLFGPIGWAHRYDIDAARDLQLGPGDQLTVVCNAEREEAARIIAVRPTDPADPYRGNAVEIVGIGAPPFDPAPPGGDPPPSGDREPRVGAPTQPAGRIAMKEPRPDEG